MNVATNRNTAKTTTDPTQRATIGQFGKINTNNDRSNSPVIGPPTRRVKVNC